jgi:3-deoxy-D-manno-octulosonic-acid transferase
VGPYTHNFKDLTEEFKQMNAILIASNAEQLVSAIHSLLANPALKKQYIKNARSFSAATDHIMDETVEVIWSYL